MGKMKEIFMEQISRQLDEQFDDDYQYNQFVNQKAIEELNEAIKPKYADSDIKYVLESVLGDANPLTEQIMHELNELYNLRHEF